MRPASRSKAASTPQPPVLNPFIRSVSVMASELKGRAKYLDRDLMAHEAENIDHQVLSESVLRPRLGSSGV